MKRLYKNIILFILPIALVFIFVSINKRLKYIGLKKECFDHGLLLYDRIYKDAKPVDLAFFGSSHTINAIDDTLIARKLNKSVFNFGFCSLGQNIYYTLLKEVLTTKKISTVVLEVREDEDRYSHKVFPFIADTKDVLFPPLLYNRDFLSDIENHFLYKIELLQDITFDRIEESPVRVTNMGFASFGDTATAAFLDSVKNVRSDSKVELTKFERNFHMKYPRSYLSKLAAICKERDIKIVFLYIPSYSRYGKPAEYETYMQYGKVLLPPKEIFDKKSNWHDEDHLNIKGSRELSLWLADHL